MFSVRITDRGTAFTANVFQEYCKVNNIQDLLVATGVPRGNGQVERINRIVITILTKLCAEDPKTSYKHVGRVQQFINSPTPRSTKIAPFKILTGINMKTKYDKELVRRIFEWKLKRTSQRFRTRIASHSKNQGSQSLSTSSEIK
ncbi:uncharacterized protein [Drosophila suzukii]|uniref:Integrase catalytic domain-containing protein n=1 Tax=Drosophila suzukii TaxID=28584 RepID=A0ABM4TYQ8_DROSZ